MDVSAFFDPAFAVLAGVVGGTVWFIAAARRRRAAAALTAVGASGFFCGAIIAAFGTAHGLAVIGTAVRRSPFEYDFRLYSLVMLGVLLATGGLRCVVSAWKLAQGDARAWRAALGATAVLLAVNLPLIPIQGFAVAFSVFLVVNLLGLILVRARLGP